MKKTIGIIFGGRSTEYEVSLESASSVIKHMNPEKYEIVLIGITKEGKWYRYKGNVEHIQDNTWMNEQFCVPAMISLNWKQGLIEFAGNEIIETHLDAVLPILHGKNGEDGSLQGLLELSDIPVVGCKTLSSALCMDKEIAHILAEAAGVKISPYVTVRAFDDVSAKLTEANKLTYPLFVKPAKAGSSFGITKVTDPEDLLAAVNVGFEHDDKVVIEEAVAGFEVGCAVLGTENLVTGELDEIEIQQGFFNFKEKYTLKTSKIHIPARISEQVAEKVKTTAKLLYRTLECTGCARVDMFLTPDLEIYFNEINTIPGFTAHSRYPSMMRHGGMSFEELIDQLIGLVLDDEDIKVN